jgi:hypothetical protein
MVTVVMVAEVTAAAGREAGARAAAARVAARAAAARAVVAKVAARAAAMEAVVMAEAAMVVEEAAARGMGLAHSSRHR